MISWKVLKNGSLWELLTNWSHKMFWQNILTKYAIFIKYLINLEIFTKFKIFGEIFVFLGPELFAPVWKSFDRCDCEYFIYIFKSHLIFFIIIIFEGLIWHNRSLNANTFYCKDRLTEVLSKKFGKWGKVESGPPQFFVSFVQQ